MKDPVPRKENRARIALPVEPSSLEAMNLGTAVVGHLRGWTPQAEAMQLWLLRSSTQA